MSEFIFEASFGNLRVEPCNVRTESPNKCHYNENGWYTFVTIFDDNILEPRAPQIEQLYKILGTIYNFQDGDLNSVPGEIKLSNKQNEIWIFKNVYPSAISFADDVDLVLILNFEEYKNQIRCPPGINAVLTWQFKECCKGPKCMS